LFKFFYTRSKKRRR